MRNLCEPQRHWPADIFDISLLENCVFFPTNDVTILQDHQLANDDIHFPVTELDTVIIRDMSCALLLMPRSHRLGLDAPISQGFVALLCGTERTELKGASLSAIPQCPAPREPKWKVCFSTRWVRR